MDKKITCIKVFWLNPETNYRPEVVIVEDKEAISKYGLHSMYITRLRCTSKKEAIKEGKKYFITNAITPLKSS